MDELHQTVGNSPKYSFSHWWLEFLARIPTDRVREQPLSLLRVSSKAQRASQVLFPTQRPWDNLACREYLHKIKLGRPEGTVGIIRCDILNNTGYRNSSSLICHKQQKPRLICCPWICLWLWCQSGGLAVIRSFFLNSHWKHWKNYSYFSTITSYCLDLSVKRRMFGFFFFPNV